MRTIPSTEQGIVSALDIPGTGNLNKSFSSADPEKETQEGSFPPPTNSVGGSRVIGQGVCKISLPIGRLL